jgi:Fur family transcriptional regulator, iron response regulator
MRAKVEFEAERPGTARDGRLSRAEVAAEGLLREAGLRPTRQRIALARILWAKGDRHVAAETVYEEALAAGAGVSLATVYNTLNQFTAAGLLRELAVSGNRTFYDTNVTPHHHFFEEGEGRMIDLPAEAVEVGRLPAAPNGMEIVAVEVLVRVRRRDD